MGTSTGLRSRAARAVAWNGAERWLVRAVTMVTFVFLGRVLQPEDFGLIALATACTTFLGVLADLGFSTWLVQARDVGAREASTAFWTSALLGLATAALLVVGAGPLALLLGSPDLAGILRALSPSLVIAGITGTPTALLTRHMRFRELAVRQVIAAVAGSVVGMTTAVLTRSVWALVAQHLTQQAVACVALYAVSGWRPEARWSRALAIDIARFGTKILTVTMLQQARDQGEVLLIGRILGPGPLGYWTIAVRLIAMVKQISLSVIATVSTPAFMEVRDDEGRLTRAYESSLAAGTAVIGPCMACLALVSPVAIPLVFGDQWSQVVPVAVVLSCAAIISPMTYFDRAILLARERVDVEVRFVLAVVVVHLVSVVVVGPHGLLPLALVITARSLVTVPARVGLLHRFAGMPFVAHRRALLVTCVAVLAAALCWPMVAVPAVSTWPVLAGSSAVYFSLYAALLYLTNRSLVRQLTRDVVALLRRQESM